MSIPGSVNPLFLGAAGQATGGGEYQIERSVRFNSPDSAYLSRTPASSGNRKTWTWAGWVNIDGQALTPSSFGEFDTNGVWQPIDYAGIYGLVSVAEATGALPIFNTTDTYGAVKGTGTRTDTNSASIVLALPMDGTNGGTSFGDQSAVIKGSGSAKTSITAPPPH
jgi:hypothetical protein